MTKHKNLMFISSILFSVFITIYSFFGSGLKINKNIDNTLSVTKHGREFLISNEPGKLFFYDGNKKIREISISEKFNIKEYNALVAKYKPNCALVAAATAGVAFAAFIQGAGAFLNVFGLATTELEGLFALAGSGATVAEVAAAIKGALGFWAFAGVITGAAV